MLTLHTRLLRGAMDDVTAVLAAARDAYRRREWGAAREGLLAARDSAGLSPEDSGMLADAAWWLGLVDESTAAGEAAYRGHLRDRRPRQAAWAAIGIAVNHLLRGAETIGSGWIGQAARLLADEPECAEHGYVRYLVEVEAALDGPDRDAVIEAAREIRELGRRHGDPNLVAMGALGEGRVLLGHGRVAEGFAMLDEAMGAVLSEDLAPDWAGNIYCHMIAACHEMVDIRRARQWTGATERWLATLPAAVLFTGICRVHRSQLSQLGGAWEQSRREAALVCAELADIHCVSAAEGHYQVGEICRLRGELAAAEHAYQRAHALGRDPQPGLALLRLAQRRIGTAATSIRVALLAEGRSRLSRARLCAAQVEIALAAADVATARKAADELADTAATWGSSGLAAMAGQARGAALLAEGHPAEALPVLRAACRLWQELDAGYDAARVRVLLALSYRKLGDEDAAARELRAAAAVFDGLGASTDAAAVTALRERPALPAGLTEREVEVLAVVARGRSNREVAATLGISEKTVARHLSNIFGKLGLSTRTAAAAFAYEHGLAITGDG